jgi:thiol-disulfide isomerase/thioredoxin
MRKFSIVWILSIIIFLSACETKNEYQPAPGVFLGKIVGAENRELFIRQETINSNTVDTIQVNPDGTFLYDIMLDKPSYFTLFVGRNQVMVYMQPGDSVNFDADVQMFDNATFSGSSSVYNEYLTKYSQKQGDFAQQMQSVFRAKEAQANQTMDSLRADQMAVLTEMEANFSNMDPMFLETEQNRIKYFWGLNHVMYPLYYAYYNQIDDYETSPDYDTYLAELSLDESKWLYIPEYRQFVSNYLNSKVSGYFEDTALMAEQASFTAYQLTQIKELFQNSDVRSYLAYRIMKDHVSYDGIKDYDVIYPLFSELCTAESFQSEINAELAEWDNLKTGKPAHDFTGVTLTGDSVRLSDFVGKYVYVDVWATWCNPCLREIPFLMNVEKEFEGRNIVFLGVSVDRNKEAWESMMTTKELAGTQIYVGLSEDLSGYYKISGIPRFMLFDKDGNILEVSADRPSGNIASRLNSLDGL